jgi:putative methyltransferase (TIGR04325 family)
MRRSSWSKANQMVRLRAIARELLPPVVARYLARAIQSATSGGPEWEYCPEGAAAWDRFRGWNDPSVAEAQRAKWPAFMATLAEPKPLGVAHEASTISSGDYAAHNTLMTFGYVLARAAHGRQRLSMLDWGGGSGHYAAVARALLPDVSIDYVCRDLPLLCSLGRDLTPVASFVDNDDVALSRRYDLVYASSSAHYSRDLYGLLARLCAASGDWLMITRMPVIEKHKDFVVRQRPWANGYRTEYVCWFVNRERMLSAIQGAGFRFVREFLVDERPIVPDAPEQCRYGGFLFQRSG